MNCEAKRKRGVYILDKKNKTYLIKEIAKTINEKKQIVEGKKN